MTVIKSRLILPISIPAHPDVYKIGIRRNGYVPDEYVQFGFQYFDKDNKIIGDGCLICSWRISCRQIIEWDDDFIPSLLNLIKDLHK